MLFGIKHRQLFGWFTLNWLNNVAITTRPWPRGERRIATTTLQYVEVCGFVPARRVRSRSAGSFRLGGFVLARVYVELRSVRATCLRCWFTPICVTIILMLTCMQCCSWHVTQQDGVLPGRSNRQHSPAGPVNMRRNMRCL